MSNEFTYFTAIVHKDQDSAYGMHFPDLEGVFSAADEERHIRANLMEALELALEDLKELPVQRPIEQLAQDPEIKKELIDGAFFYTVPYFRDIGKTVKANLTFDAAMLEAIDDEAKRRGVTRSAFLAAAAREVIGT